MSRTVQHTATLSLADNIRAGKHLLFALKKEEREREKMMVRPFLSIQHVSVPYAFLIPPNTQYCTYTGEGVGGKNLFQRRVYFATNVGSSVGRTEQARHEQTADESRHTNSHTHTLASPTWYLL